MITELLSKLLNNLADVKLSPAIVSSGINIDSYTFCGDGSCSGDCVGGCLGSPRGSYGTPCMDGSCSGDCVGGCTGTPAGGF